MIDNINYQFTQLEHDEYPKIKFRSKSFDQLPIDTDNHQHVSNTTRTEMDLTGIGCEMMDEIHEDSIRSQSAPVTPTKMFDKEFLSYEQEEMFVDNFVYNIDLSNGNQSTRPTQSRREIFFDDDDAPDDRSFEHRVTGNFLSSSMINPCLTITEENEEELEQLRRDDHEEEELKKQNHFSKINDGSIPKITLHDNDDRADLLENDQEKKSTMINEEYDERLSTIYEAPSPQLRTDDEEIYDDTYDKLIVYDIANVKPIEQPKNIKSESILPSYCSPKLDRTRLRSCFTNASIPNCPTSTMITSPSASHLCGTTTTIHSKVFQPSLPISKTISLSPVSDIRNISINKSLGSFPIDQESPCKTSPISLSVPMLLLSHPIEQSTSMLDNNKSIPYEHIKRTKVIQLSSSSLSDFLIPTPSSTLKSTIHYEEVPSVHHSLTDCSSIPQMSCCIPLVDEDCSRRNKSSDDNQRRPSFTRRILTNGLLLSHCSNSNPTYRRPQPPLTFNQHHRHHLKPKSEEKLSSLSSPIVSSGSSSESPSPSGEKFISRSDYLLQQQQAQSLSQQRKATSLKTIANSSSSKILYPIEFPSTDIDPSWYQRHASHQHKVPTSDSGIVIDTAGTRLTSNSSIEENDVDGVSIDIIKSNKLKQYETNYRQTLTDLNLIKKNIVDIESRLSEAMRELELERALVEGEHEIVLKDILDASETDQDKLRHLYNDLQFLNDRIMTEKNSIRNEIVYTQQTLFKLEHELRQLEEQYRPSDDKILKKKEILTQTRQKHEDLEFQLMELETRCETELEQAEMKFQNEQIFITQNSKLRQNTLRDLDHQQSLLLQQVLLEKDKLEREKQKFKLLFKQKKSQATELEQKIHSMSSPTIKDTRSTMYHSTPSNLYSSLTHSDQISSTKLEDQQRKLNDIKEMIALAKLEKMNILEEQLRDRYSELVQMDDERIKQVELTHEVKLREKNRIQERPLTRYLPIRSLDFDLRAHIEGAGHLIHSSHMHLTPTSCRGFLLKMGGMKFKTWNRRWFVFDRKRRSLFYYQDKTETKLRGCIYFQSIVEVYVDHLQSISLRSPEPREATFIVKTLERSYYLVAPTVESMRVWVDVIITGAEGNTFAGDN